MENTNPILAKWIEKQKDYLESSKGKYIHFDNYTTYKRNINLVADRNFIAKHAFYPFIGYAKNERRFIVDKESKQRVIQNKTRPLAYAAHFDSLVYSYYATELDDYYEKILKNEPCSESIVAYRKLETKQSTISIAIDVFKKIANVSDIENAIILTFDVEQFYPSIRHDLLESIWKELINIKRFSEKPDHLNVFNHITKYELVDKDKLEKILKDKKIVPNKITRRYFDSPQQYREIIKKYKLIEKNTSGIGITQGSAISPLLSNIYMLNFDKLMHNLIEDTEYGLYRRYSDDILIVCNKSNYEAIIDNVKAQLKNIGLNISLSKSEIFTFIKDSKGIHRPHEILKDKRKDIIYLGIQFNGQTISIKEKTRNRYIKKIRHRAKITINDANNSIVTEPFTRKLYVKFTQLGRKIAGKKFQGNFISYANKVKSEAEKIDMPNEIKKQIKNPIETVNKILKQEKKKKLARSDKSIKPTNSKRKNNHYDNGGV